MEMAFILQSTMIDTSADAMRHPPKLLNYITLINFCVWVILTTILFSLRWPLQPEGNDTVSAPATSSDVLSTEHGSTMSSDVSFRQPRR